MICEAQEKLATSQLKKARFKYFKHITDLLAEVGIVYISNTKRDNVRNNWKSKALTLLNTR